MTAISFALITFVSTFACALLGIAIRSALPPTHLSKDSQDVIRLGMGLVATMTALLLGLVTAAAKGSFDSQDAAVRTAATGVLTLDRLLARYGPETQPIREMLRRAVVERAEALFPENGATPAGAAIAQQQLDSSPAAERVEDQILQLAAGTETQRWLKSEALKLTEEVLRTRWRILGNAEGSVPRMMLVVVIFWLATTFGSFGVSAPKNATVITVFALAALSVAAAVFLILELDGALTGIIRISSAPFRLALANLGH